jgi:hypothetical protein
MTMIIQDLQSSIAVQEFNPNDPPIAYRLVYMFRTMEEYRGKAAVLTADITRLTELVKGLEIT